MQTCSTIREVRAQIQAWRAKGERIAFVPTMGNLHQGHVSLVQRAREVAPRVVVSIFVNPLQFGAGEDFGSYPRTPEADAEKLQAAGTALLFLPAEHEMYPRGREGVTQVEVPGISELLCGASRPGHFRGVATVVSKLFHIVQPDVALFGEKDYQQLLVIRRMVADLDFPLEVLGVPTLREPDGLAMSSRNGYLTAEERARAPALHAALSQVAEGLRSGRRDYGALEQEVSAALDTKGFRTDYISVRRATDLAPPAADRQLVVLGAARLGRTRLIDNLLVHME
jgi:pantoate--beta-alanine ligase